MLTHLKAISDAGKIIDAEFSVERTTGGFDIVIESRSGKSASASKRNPDYEKLFELVLIRASNFDCSLAGAWVETGHTTHLSPEERALTPPDLAYPVVLSQVPDLRALRIAVAGRQGAIGRQPGALGPGNRNKRVRLSFAAAAKTEQEYAIAIVEGDLSPFDGMLGDTGLPSPKSPKAWDLEALRKLLARYDTAAPRVRKAVSRRIERGPIGDMMKEVHNRHCQICSALDFLMPTFLNKSGVTYVEAHHVVPVSSGTAGALRAENVLVVCPMHHRELHSGAGALVKDLGQAFEVRVALGTVVIPKTDLLIAMKEK